MNNDKTIVIKSQTQPDGGEGYSAGQAVRGNAQGEEGLSANVRGDEQKSSEATRNRDEPATQGEVPYSSHEEGRILGARARKGILNIPEYRNAVLSDSPGLAKQAYPG